MGIMDHLTGQKILAAMQRGEFDNLPGSGKPIQWKDNPLAPVYEKMAYDLLQSNGFTLPWIDLGNELRAERTALRQSLKEWLRQNPASAAGAITHDLQDRLARLNKKIMDYNRSVPVEALQVSFVDLHRELENLQRENPEF